MQITSPPKKYITHGWHHYKMSAQKQSSWNEATELKGDEADRISQPNPMVFLKTLR
jgi:hypothetical protein